MRLSGEPRLLPAVGPLRRSGLTPQPEAFICEDALREAKSFLGIDVTDRDALGNRWEIE